MAAPFTFLARMLCGRAVFDEITLYLLIMGLITSPLSIVTGLISWVVIYETKAKRVFNVKFALGMLLFLAILTTTLLRLTGPETVHTKPRCYFNRKVNMPSQGYLNGDQRLWRNRLAL